MKKLAKILRLTTWLMIALLTQVTTTHAASPSEDKPLDNTRLRIGVTANYPPIIFKEDGQLKGIEIDLARALERGLGVPISFVELAWTALYPALRDGKIDMVMAGASVTEKRQDFVSFTKPYMRIGQMALVREQTLGHLAAPSDMLAPNRRIGVEANTTGEAYVRDNLKQANLVVFDSAAQAVDALVAGKLDYVIHDAPTVWHLTLNPRYAEKSLVALYKPLTEEWLAWAVRKDDTQLRDALNKQLAKLKSNGTVGQIINRWLAVTVEVDAQAP